MASEFGERLQARVLELDYGVLEHARQKRYTISQTLIDELGKFVGCSEAEIAEVMVDQGISYLPNPYREFLLRMGKGTGWVLFSGAYCLYESLKKLKLWFKSDFVPADQFPKDAFVFLSYQGSEYFYFLTGDQDDDPAVYMYGHEATIEQQSEHLSEWFFKQIESYKDDDEN